MRLEHALDEFGIAERRRKRGEEGRRAALALAALREYLLDYSGHEEAREVTPRDLFGFLLDYYPAEETPDTEVALSLLDTTAGLANWLLERGQRGLASFVEAEDRLREDLQRVLAALEALEEHTDRDRLGPPLLAEVSTDRNTHEPGHPEDAPDVPDAPAEGGSELLGELGSGLDRMVRLDEVEYPDADQDYYTVTEVREDGFIVGSAAREALGQPPAFVRAPLPAGLLRPGDIIHARLRPPPRAGRRRVGSCSPSLESVPEATIERIRTEELSAPQALVEEAVRRAFLAASSVAALPTGVKNDTLLDIARGLVLDGDALLAANEVDVREGEAQRLPASVVDRIHLTRERLGNIAEAVRAVAAFPDPVGEVLRGQRRPNGLVIQEVRVPLGVVAVIGDGRPNTTIDSISLCLKAGNVLIMMGSAHAARTDAAVRELVERAAARNQLPDGAIQILPTTDPAAREHLGRMSRHVEVLIPHGTKEELRAIRETATVPIVETGAGNCHTFVERTARLEMAADIAFNAKVQRPGTVNAMQTLLVDQPIARQFLPIIGPRMQAVGVELRGCEATRAILPGVRPALEEDWERETLSLILTVRVVDGLDEAIAHIGRYGGNLSEAIVTQDYAAGKRFCERIDAAAVYINASTRFTDGGEFGLGAELGISTQKLHRRGPIALRALTTWKWIIQGEGQVRD